MGSVHHKEKWDCNPYLNGQGPPAKEAGEKRASGDGVEEAIKKELRIVGDQPDGDMKWRSLPERLPGYPHCGTIEIEYNFKDGIQTGKHPRPGMPYTGLRAVAYLPDNPEGTKTRQQLKQAFDQGLTFTVATRSNGQEGVTWTDIPHCTGFSNPDPQYLNAVKQVLKSKGIE